MPDSTPFDIKRAVSAARLGGRATEEVLFDALHAYAARVMPFTEMNMLAIRTIEDGRARSRRNAKNPSLHSHDDRRESVMEPRSGDSNPTSAADLLS